MPNPAASPLTPEAAQNFGPAGVELIEDTSDHTGLWCCLKFRTDTVFNAIKGNGMTGTFTGKTFLAGTSIENGLGFTFIDLTSGSVIAYKM